MICLHNECALCLTVIRFTTVYICTVVDGHEDVMMIFLTDSHALLIFLVGPSWPEPQSGAALCSSAEIDVTEEFKAITCGLPHL